LKIKTKKPLEIFVEFKIAVVGPITSFVIAAILATSLCLLIYVTTGSNNNSRINNTDNISAIIVAGVLQYGALVNVLLGGINPYLRFLPMVGGYSGQLFSDRNVITINLQKLQQELE
jgi:hypothetical protein